ncbi:hypothetical protein LGL55_10635 [Clostridium tagluense]|uniref:hypothetical protein n=1 Tax=Clostridium tagluense TaxID=360422 RepID=UPI001CF487D9|nr:hypothetical protein [Clostridium tagluense]MCB2311604.1 hypothetical protein [Clostridium tagluense]MCB2316328.1 hypothetical protein [Clostridium tagluense]MCB2321288.1 hypothetical protein [Clostridium tagluense]MCB2326197.1 hypothetical protein [Clostridium tagluense]MCB2331024.1 hypothetical protein [Clostridium tagluense]
MFIFGMYCAVFILPISIVFVIISGFIKANRQCKNMQIENNKNNALKIIEDNKYKEELIFRQKNLNSIDKD